MTQERSHDKEPFALADLIERARHHKMTPEEIFEQKVSFICGMQKLSTPGYTQEEIRHLLRAGSAVPTAEPARKLTKPAMIGSTQFGVGVDESTVIERAQREHEYFVKHRGVPEWTEEAKARLNLALFGKSDQPIAWVTGDGRLFHTKQAAELVPGYTVYPLYAHSTVVPSAELHRIDQAGLDAAAWELQRSFGREGSIYGIKACEEIARLAVATYQRTVAPTEGARR